MKNVSGKSSVWMWVLIGLCVLVCVPLVFLAGKVVTYVSLRSLQHGDSRNVSYAIAHLRSSNSFYRDAAARGLGSIGPEAGTAVPDLLIALDDESPQVASSAAWALGHIHYVGRGRVVAIDKDVVDGLVQALDHPHREVRRYAAYAISMVGPASSSAVPKLIKLLNDTHMAYMAARALGKMGPAAREAIPNLTALLVNPHDGVRAEAALALSRLQPLPDESVAAIKRLRNDDVDFVRKAAWEAIQAIPYSGKSPRS